MKPTPEQYKAKLNALIEAIAMDYDNDALFHFITAESFDKLFRYLGCKIETKIVMEAA